MSDTTPRRRWFAYSLRTLFVVITLISCWLGYQLNWIRQRHQFLDAQRASGIFHRLQTGSSPNPFFASRAAPGMLGLFREPGHESVEVTVDATNYPHFSARDQQRIDRAKSLFPEAKIYLTSLTPNAAGEIARVWITEAH